MIRALAILLGTLLGLALAAAFAGRVAHLRLAAFVALPGWTAGLTDRSGLPSGRWEGPLPGWPVGAVDWAVRGVSAEGLTYAVRGATPGGPLEAALRLPPLPMTLQIEATDQALDLAQLIAGAEAAGLSGLLVLDRLDSAVALPGGEVRRLRGTGEIRGLGLQGAAFGAVPVEIEAAGETGWQVRVTLDGPLTGDLSVSGLYDSSALRIEGTLRETGALPSALRAFLASVASEADGTWQIGAGVDRRDLLAVP